MKIRNFGEKNRRFFRIVSNFSELEKFFPNFYRIKSEMNEMSHNYQIIYQLRSQMSHIQFSQ